MPHCSLWGCLYHCIIDSLHIMLHQLDIVGYFVKYCLSLLNLCGVVTFVRFLVPLVDYLSYHHIILPLPDPSFF